MRVTFDIGVVMYMTKPLREMMGEIRSIWRWKDEGQSLGSKRFGPEHAGASMFEPARPGPLPRPLLHSVLVPQPTSSALCYYSLPLSPPCIIFTYTYTHIYVYIYIIIFH